jgi:DNA-binding transcriptional regulator YdaS (Cro superfamily)
MQKSVVINYFGNQTKVARKLNISDASVSEWGEIIPEKQALRLERITNGALQYDPTLYKKAA